MKKAKILLIIIVILFGIFLIDFSLISIFKTKPLFAISFDTIKDGGSKEYYGIGHKVFKCNTLSGDKSTKIGFYNIKYTCNNDTVKIDTSNFTIINEANNCESKSITEKFYKDNKYTYSFECKQSNTTFIKFIDGTNVTIRDALNDGLVTISQIQNKLEQENSKISIIKEPNFNIDVTYSNECNIQKMITKEMSSTYKALDYDLYTYCLDDISITINNEKLNLRDALASGKINLEDIIYSMEFSSKWAQTIKNIYENDVIEYKNFSYTILNCNNKFKEYYIGKNDMKYDNNFCN